MQAGFATTEQLGAQVASGSASVNARPRGADTVAKILHVDTQQAASNSSLQCNTAMSSQLALIKRCRDCPTLHDRYGGLQINQTKGSLQLNEQSGVMTVWFLNF